MPSVVSGIIKFGKLLITAYQTAGAVTQFLVKVAAVVLLEQVTSRLFGVKVPKGAEISGRQVMSRSSVEHRKVVYGQSLISGPVVYNNLTGDNGEYLWFVVALAHGESEDFTEIWFDGDSFSTSNIDWTPGVAGADGTGTGDVTSTRWTGENSTKAVRVFYYLGHADQVTSGVLTTAFGTQFTANHRGRGVTYMVTSFLYNEDTEKVWQKGVPQNIKALVKGRKIYDPRKDSTEVIDNSTSPLTYGSGTHRYTDSTTWEWSDNPALCVADYLFNFMDVDSAVGIDWASVAVAADHCDESVNIGPAASPTNTQTRFTCNGALSLGSSHKENIESLLSSFNGRLSYSGGVWRLRSSVWEASSLSIDADSLAADVEVRGSAPKSERFNLIRGYFVDPDRKYEGAEFPHVSSSTYLARDAGQVISYDLELPFTNNHYMAQRIGYRLLEQGNNQIVCALTMNEAGAKVCIGDIVDVTLDDFSWSSKTFRCVDWSRNDSGTFKVVLREDSSSSYDDPLVSDYKEVNSTEATIASDVIPAPSGLTATAGVGGIRLDWTNPPYASYDVIDIYEDTDSSWSGATKIASVRADSYFVSRAAGTTYYYWIRARLGSGQESIRDPDSDTTTISAAATGGSDGDSIFYASVYKRNSGAPATPSVDDGSFNFTSQTLTPPSGWSATVPSVGSPTLPVYISHGVFSISGTSGTDSTVTWSSPTLLAQDGADGAAGSDGADSVTVNYTNNSHAVPVDNGGTETWTGSGGLLYAYEGSTVLTLDTNTQGTAYPVTPGEYRLDITKVSGDTLTEPAITGQTTTTATIAAWAGDLTTATVYRITAYILTSDSTQVSLSTDVTLSPSDQGSDGAAGDPGAAGADGDDAFAMNYTNNSHAVPVTNTGTETWTGSGGKCYIFEGSTLLTLNTNTQTGSYAGLSNGEYNLNITAVSGDTLTEPAITGQTTTTATVADWAGDLTQATVYQLDAYVQGSAGSQVTITEYITLSPSDQGADGSVGTDAVTINYTNSSHAVPVTNLGVETWTSSGGKCYIFEGATVLTLNTNTQTGSYAGLSNGEYNLNITKVSGNTLTEPAITGQTTTTATIADWAGNLTGVTVYKLDAYVQNSNGDQITLTEYITLSPADQGADGADGTDGTDGEDLTSDITAIGGNIIDFQSSPTDAAVGFKVDNNGNAYSYNNNLKVYSSLGTWLNTGAAGDYDVGLFKDAGTHDTPSGSSIDTWLDAGTDRAWTFEETGSGTYSLDGEIKWRNGTTFEVLGSASVNLSVSVI